MSARILAAAGLLASVLAANLLTARYGLIPAGFGLLVPAGTYTAGAALAVRDALDRAGGLGWVLPTLAVGVILSALLAGPALAVASAAAFACSELADLAVWRTLRRRTIAGAVAASNAAGAVVDTLVFLPLSGLPVTAAAIGGQILVKAGWITAAALLVLAAARTFRPRQVTA